jgi:hypothetical protein
VNEPAARTKPAIFATVSSVTSSLIFVSILAVLRFEEWEAYAAFIVVSFVLWPLWYWTAFRHRDNFQPESWKASYLSGFGWGVFGAVNLTESLLQHHRDFSERTGALFLSAILGICQLVLALTYLRKGFRLRNSQ